MNLTEMTFEYEGKRVRVVGAFSPGNVDLETVGVVDESEVDPEPFEAKTAKLLHNGTPLPELTFIHECGYGPCRSNGHEVHIVGAVIPLNAAPTLVQSRRVSNNSEFEGAAEHYILKD